MSRWPATHVGIVRHPALRWFGVSADGYMGHAPVDALMECSAQAWG